MFKAAFAQFENRKDLAFLCYVYAASEDRRQALRWVAVLDRQSKQKYVGPEDITKVYAALCDLDQAVRWLERVCKERATGMCYLKVSPEWDPLRGGPHFQDLLRPMNLTGK
jgi:hypothetical protein